jgi:hypothetical protein
MSDIRVKMAKKFETRGCREMASWASISGVQGALTSGAGFVPLLVDLGL